MRSGVWVVAHGGWCGGRPCTSPSYRSRVRAMTAVTSSFAKAPGTRRECECGSIDLRGLMAQWLHDHVLSEVRAAQLRLKTGSADADWAARELRDLEHRLREEQLSAAIATGDVLVGEILQVHVRRLVALGIVIDVTSSAEVGRSVGGCDASQLASAVAVLVGNAVNAGAGRVSIAVESTAHGLQVSVGDDAGGFDLDAVPVGRALSRLRSRVGSANVWASRSSGLSVVHVRLSGGGRQGQSSV